MMVTNQNAVFKPYNHNPTSGDTFGSKFQSSQSGRLLPSASCCTSILKAATSCGNK